MSSRMSPIKLNLIVACDSKMGIGVKNDLPWRLRKEMNHFNRMTTGDSYDLAKHPGSENKRNVVLMGRKTYESIPEKFRPLKNRLNVVLSRDTEISPHENMVAFKSWEDAMKYLEKPQIQEEIDQVWVVGGSHIYKMAMESPFLYRIYLTKLAKEFDCDTFFPEFDPAEYKLVTDPKVSQEEQEEDGIRYTFYVYEKL
ncbi:dihydrofolate reductase [Folsomia candida]|uniref:dihydrofolate reductase n=1 Tax=Folsomia candida TaxID=158441 RepID=A0A226CWE2_FOLCA|nr:dihydrofolate reductase [Folsomia candida]XP_035701540.1 dihydrofolate reductase [Folsomia candida]XP_035701541.1 dihydrofolate reductase [Folsomia candida]OXA37269.1 Dihydrofolate reductase [Folsomia candida]